MRITFKLVQRMAASYGHSCEWERGQIVIAPEYRYHSEYGMETVCESVAEAWDEVNSLPYPDRCPK